MKKINFGYLFKKYGIALVFVLICAIFTAFRPNFINPNNLIEILRQVSFYGIVAVGMTFCLLTGGIDLSVGSNVGLALIVCAVFMAAKPISPDLTGGTNINPIIGAVLGILVSTGVGFFNGALINEINIPPLIVTLGMLEVIRGVVYVMTGAMPIYEGFEDYFRFLGQGSIGPIPVPVIIFLVIMAVGWIVLNKTVYGRYVYCLGGNAEVARLSGIDIKKIRYSVYVISGFLCGITGIILLSRLNSGQPRAAMGYEMEVVTACVLGGVSIAGGEGKLMGVFFGVLIMGILFNGLIQMNLSEFYQMIIKGAVLLMAVGLDTMSNARKRKLSEKAISKAKAGNV
ncbi:MAG: ABC transporter permease [Pelolinea sp.]|nr:ABC transporter permease [Pelolinea sp.]